MFFFHSIKIFLELRKTPKSDITRQPICETNLDRLPTLICVATNSFDKTNTDRPTTNAGPRIEACAIFFLYNKWH